MKVLHGEREIHITTSIGVAIYPLNGKDSDEMLTLADRLLYRAKHAGRNWIMVAE